MWGTAETGPAILFTIWMVLVRVMDKAIQEKIYRNPKEEVYLGKNLLWYLNEVLLESNGFLDAEGFPLFQENANNLIRVLDKTDQRDLLLIAELHRNLGDFESCLEVLDQVTEPNLQPLAYGLFKKCRANDSKVFELE